MKLHTYTLNDLRQAVADGESLYALDTGSDSMDDVLFGIDVQEIVNDLCYEFDTNELPAHWTIRQVSLEEVEARFK
ncbi:MAG: hypothetical protein M3Z21_15255 [Pseudomonadota bacterium]|nr:hypothetical protein [Pseudomonadota bacterium]